LEEFQSFKSLKRYNDITADFDVRSIFHEQDTISNPLQIFIDQRFLAWDDESNIFVHQYRLQNRSQNNYDSVYFSLFTDYAISNKVDNKLKYDSAYQLSYAYDEAENEFVGLSFMGTQDSIFYAFDLAEENAHTSDLDNDSLKQNIIHNALVNPFSKTEAGQLSGGNNVGGMHGLMIPSFSAATTETFSFALVRGNSLTELQALVQKARDKDSLTVLSPPFEKQILICRDDTPVLEAQDGFSLKVYASPSIDTVLYEGSAFETGTISTDTTFYIAEVDTAGISTIRKRWLVTISKPNAGFAVPEEPLLLEPEITNSFRFFDESEDAVSWNWSFSNGFTSTQQNPNITIEEAGEYQVELIVSNNQACKDTLVQSFQAVMRSPKPQISNQEICKSSSLTLYDPAIDEITVYSDSLMTEQLFKGAEFSVETIDQDTTFYIRNEIGEYPSKLTEVQVDLIPIEANIQVSLDLNSSNEGMQGIATSNSEYAANIVWLMGTDTLGMENEIYFDLVDLSNENLKLIAISESGCIDSAVFETSKSQLPQFADYYLCQSQSISLTATNSNAVYYYADENLSEFIGKGSNVTISEVTEDISIFAVNVEDIEPSDVVEVPIYVSELTADFNISQDTINIAFDNSIALEALSESATTWTWYLNEDEIGSSQNLQYEVGESGVFNIGLLVSDSLGCIEQFEQTLVVFNDPLLGSKKELKSYFSIFPNPADKMIHLSAEDQFQYDSYTIIDTKGQEKMSHENIKPIIQTEIIDVSELNEGAYYLIIRKGNMEASFLFVIRR
jgi:PKD repeat protein